MPGVDCEEWAAKTNYKKLPKKKTQEKTAMATKEAAAPTIGGMTIDPAQQSMQSLHPKTFAGNAVRSAIEGHSSVQHAKPAKNFSDVLNLASKVHPQLGVAGLRAATAIQSAPIATTPVGKMTPGQKKDFGIQQQGKAKDLIGSAMSQAPAILEARRQASKPPAAVAAPPASVAAPSFKTSTNPAILALGSGPGYNLEHPPTTSTPLKSRIGTVDSPATVPLKPAAPEQGMIQKLMTLIQTKPGLAAALGIGGAAAGYGAYRGAKALMGGGKKSKPKKESSGEDDSEGQEKAAAMRKTAVVHEVVDGYLDFLAAEAEGEKRAVIRRIQAEFATSGNLVRSIEKGAGCTEADAASRALSIAGAVEKQASYFLSQC